MASGLPPPPINDKPGSFTWLEWYRQLRNYVSTSGSVPWYIINFSGSNITDIAKRDHNQMQSVQGGTSGEKYHITANQHEAVSHMTWNSQDGTIDIDMGLDGVTQQVGLEQYMLVINTTGSQINNGQVVGFNGSSSGYVAGKLYQASGSDPSMYFIGVATMDIPDTTAGYITTYGIVRDINTTGSAVSETWAAGDVLYAHPTIAGSLTKVKPTAPNIVIPVGAVLVANATAGAIMVRPVITNQQLYGVFTDTTDQTASAINTPTLVTFDTTDISEGVSRGTPTSRIVVANSGLYNFKFSLQVTSTSSSTQELTIWARKNGTDIPNSAGRITVAGNNSTVVPSWDYSVSMAANDYFELVWATDNTNVTLLADPAQTTPFVRPAVPSVLLTVTQIIQ